MPLFALTFVFQWGCVYPTPLPWKCCSGVRLLDQTSSSLQVFWRLISSLDELGIDFYQQQTSSEEPFCLFNMGQVHLCSHMIKFSSFVSTLALFFLPLSHLTKLNCFLIQHLPALCYFLVLDCLTSKSVQASQHHLQWVTLIVYTIFLPQRCKEMLHYSVQFTGWWLSNYNCIAIFLQPVYEPSCPGFCEFFAFLFLFLAWSLYEQLMDIQGLGSWLLRLRWGHWNALLHYLKCAKSILCPRYLWKQHFNIVHITTILEGTWSRMTVSNCSRKSWTRQRKYLLDPWQPSPVSDFLAKLVLMYHWSQGNILSSNSAFRCFMFFW